MKKLIAIAGAAALAACSQGEAPAEEDANAAAAEAPAEEESMAGTYDVTAADGTVTATTIDADGNYTVTAGDEQVASGTVAVTNGQTCFNSSEEGSAPECWTDGEPAEDGSWVATSDDGETVTVKKREEEAAAE